MKYQTCTSEDIEYFTSICPGRVSAFEKVHEDYHHD